MKRITLPHKVGDYTCPVNGVEDMYEWKTGVRMPDMLLFYLSTLGFVYIRQKRAPAPRMVFWGAGMGKPQHRFLEDVLGYQWTCSEGGSFTSALHKATASIDRGLPVILGPLDMYHLPYYAKFYHNLHVPIHYVLMVGYDETAVYVQDNSRPEVQRVPVSDLQPAWNVNVPGQGKKNTLVTLEFNAQIASLEALTRNGLHKRAGLNLHPPVGFMGVRGMRKLAAELPKWKDELTPEQMDASLQHLATFTCSVVPMPPARLAPYAAPMNDQHQAMRERFASALREWAATYNEPRWALAAGHFAASGERIGQLTDLAVDALQGSPSALEKAPALIKEIADQEEQGYRLLCAA